MVYSIFPTNETLTLLQTGIDTTSLSLCIYTVISILAYYVFYVIID